MRSVEPDGDLLELDYTARTDDDAHTRGGKGRGMASVRTHIRIDRPAEQVWNVVSDVGAIADWFPMIESSSASGSTRTCTMAGGGELEEEIVTNDSELRRLQYHITEGVPLEYHLATVDVLDDGDGALVIYSADVQPAEAAVLMGPTFESGLEGLKAHLEG